MTLCIICQGGYTIYSNDAIILIHGWLRKQTSCFNTYEEITANQQAQGKTLSP